MEHPGETKRPLDKYYAKIAKGKKYSCDSNCPGPSDAVEQAKSIGYSGQEIESVPKGAVTGMGCGNPTALAELKEGQTVLDIGCGVGLDVFLAAQKVGPTGRVIGIDASPEMIQKARENALKGKYKNVELEIGQTENLPLRAECIDVVISNCVINHSPDKLAAFKEMLRVLKPDGKILIADLVAEGQFSSELMCELDTVWREWVAGAVGRQKYLDIIREAEFRDIQIIAEKPFNMAEMNDHLKGRIISIHIRAYKRRDEL